MIASVKMKIEVVVKKEERAGETTLQDLFIFKNNENKI